MKKAIKLFIAAVVTTTLLFSCGTSRKYGCPSQVNNHDLNIIQTVA